MEGQSDSPKVMLLSDVRMRRGGREKLKEKRSLVGVGVWLVWVAESRNKNRRERRICQRQPQSFRVSLLLQGLNLGMPELEGLLGSREHTPFILQIGKLRPGEVE